MLEFHFAVAEDGVPRCVGVDVRSFTLSPDGRHARPVAEGLQQVATKVWRDIAIQKEMTEAIDEFIFSQLSKLAMTETQKRSARRAGPKSFWTKERLADVAAVYRANLGTRAPTQAVADAFDVSPSMGAKLVARAREAGLLGKTSKGRAGGASPKKQPTKKRTRR